MILDDWSNAHRARQHVWCLYVGPVYVSGGWANGDVWHPMIYTNYTYTLKRDFWAPVACHIGLVLERRSQPMSPLLMGTVDFVLTSLLTFGHEHWTHGISRCLYLPTFVPVMLFNSRWFVYLLMRDISIWFII